MSSPPDPPADGPLDGRRAQAARNDELILEAARTVFIADPSAPIAAVAERAVVGISALYRRYPSKQDLLRRLCADGLERYIALAEAALRREDDAWDAFAEFMAAVVEADTVSLVERLAGTFAPTDELFRRSEQANALTSALIERTKAAGALRPDVEVDDVALLFEALASVRLAGAERTRELRRRYLRLVLNALHDSSMPPLPGRAPTPAEMAERWVPGS